MLDAFSKYVKLYAIKRQTTRIALKKLIESYIPEVGKPERVLSDHGTQFTSHVWSRKLRELGIRVIFSSVRHPQSNPAERVMRELGRLFRTLCSDSHTRWAKHLADIEFFFNITSHHSTGFCQFELHFGKKPKDQIMDLIIFPKNKDISHEAKIFLARDRILPNFEKRSEHKVLFQKWPLKWEIWCCLMNRSNLTI